MHPRADSVAIPVSRLALQAAMSLLPCCNSAGSSAILRPSVLTHAIWGIVGVVTQPDSKISPAIEQYIGFRRHITGTLFRPMCRTPGPTNGNCINLRHSRRSITKLSGEQSTKSRLNAAAGLLAPQFSGLRRASATRRHSDRRDHSTTQSSGPSKLAFATFLGTGARQRASGLNTLHLDPVPRS